MEKRLNRSDLGFSLAFLLMLIVAIGAFFYGVKVGAERTEAEYAAAAKSESLSEPDALNAYQQQDLVSFYHTVFLPFREFQTDWFHTLDKWAANATADPTADLKELAKTADAKYDKIRGAFVSPASPLLKQAQTDYLKSLKLFSDSFSELATAPGSQSADKVLRTMADQAFYKEGRNFALTAQNAYYSSMLKWGSTVNLDIPDPYPLPEVIEVNHWKTMPLIAKNKAIADYLSKGEVYSEFLPHDLTARIDQFIRSGQADKMKLNTIESIAELLIGTQAVRSGDFLDAKPALYPNEQLPQLPFFIPGR